MKGKLMTFFACFLMVAGMVTAQNQKVSGVVTTAADGEPVIGASVGVKGTTLGAITDLDGKFEISGVPSTAKTLVVSYVGMATKEVAIKPNVKIQLEEDAEALEEVVVQAFGTAKKSAFTGSAAVVNADKIAESQVTSVTNALAGKVAGVQMTSSNGAPGATSTIRIRGFSSINAGQDPLIIVDGAPYDGDMANLNTADVESMTVLKDAASNALYGARGANGVIMITTKKAKQNSAAQVTFDAKYGTNTRALQQYNVVTSPAQYYEMHYGAVKDYYVGQGMSEAAAWEKANKNLFSDQGNGGLGYQVYTIPEGQYLIGQNGKLNPAATLGYVKSYNNEDYLVTPDDWANIGYRTGARQEYNASVASATDKSSFFASLGYLDNEGITEGSDMTRLTGRLRADYQANKWLKVGGNMSFTKFESHFLNNNGSSTSSGNIWAFTSQMAPIYPCWIRTADGNVKIDKDGLSMMDYGNGTNAGYARPFISDANPIMDNKLNMNESEGNAATGSGFADFTLARGLVFTVNGTYNLDETRGKYFYNPYYGQFDTTGGTIEVYHSRTYTYNLQQLLNYTFTVGLHNNFNVMAGHEYYQNRYYVVGATKHQMFSPTDTELNRAVVDNAGAFSYNSMYNNEGFFGRVQYDYDSRIFGSASIRRDASSRFDPAYQWGTFWSVGGAWLLNKEAFMSDIDWIDMLKVKASIGSQGNDNISSFMYTDRYSISNSDGNVGLAFDGKGTRDITWETNTNFNAGFEFDFFKKLSGGIEYFKRTTTDMLYSFAVAASAGYTSYWDNVGDMYNKGVEAELNYNIIGTKKVRWDIFANATFLKNKITYLDPAKKTTHFWDLDGNKYFGYSSGNNVIAEGSGLYSWYMAQYAGVDQETGESLWYYNKAVYEQDADGADVYYKTYSGEGNYVTDDEEVKFAVDGDGNKILTNKDDADGSKFQTGHTVETTNKYANATYYVANKTAIPNVYGGFGTSVQAYGFDFSVNFSYQLGGWGYDSTYASFMAPPTGSNAGYNFHVDALQAWTKDTPSETIPRWQFGDTNASSTSSRFLTKASYLNIENIAVGYTLPAKWTRKALINSARLYVAADNLWYWSARQGFDPRQGYTGSNATNYSPMRSVSAGVTLKFADSQR